MDIIADIVAEADNADELRLAEIRDAEAAAIISGSDAAYDSDESCAGRKNENDLWDSDDEEEDMFGADDQANDGLYCDNMDEEDEAWVYKHLRGGQEETVTVKRRVTPQRKSNKGTGEKESMLDSQQNDNIQDSNKTSVTITEQIRMLKPRNSDAVLSCPCCFNIVCMDCQEHETYKNQFRAMFVMNIYVDWTELRWSEDDGCLIPKKSTTIPENKVPHFEEEDERNFVHSENAEQSKKKNDPLSLQDPDSNPDDAFHSVHCLQCQTQVAFLNMTDEVYHFVDCITTSA